MPSLTPKKISELDLAGTLSGQEYFPLVQSGQTKKAQLDTINAFNNGSCKCTLVSRFNTVGNDANTLEKYLQTYTLEGNTLVNDGERIELNASGTHANSSGDNLHFYFGSSTVSSGFFIAQSEYWELDVKIIRMSLTSQRVRLTVTTYPATSSVVGTTYRNIFVASETLSNDIQIAISADSGSGTANDVTIEEMTIDLHKLDPDS